MELPRSPEGPRPLLSATPPGATPYNHQHPRKERAEDKTPLFFS